MQYIEARQFESVGQRLRLRLYTPIASFWCLPGICKIRLCRYPLRRVRKFARPWKYPDWYINTIFDDAQAEP